jgi:hypothetical protein
MIRAADVDRDHVAGLLGTAYAEGRLSKDEYDDRLAAAFAARTYGELDRVIGDLPVPALSAQPAPPSAALLPVSKFNGAAQASFAFGLAQLIMLGPLGTIPAIVFGHVALRQIQRTGERGTGLAVAGLVLGWGAVAVGIVMLVVTLLSLSQGAPAPMPVPGP